MLDYATWAHAAFTDGSLSSYISTQDHGAMQRRHTSAAVYLTSHTDANASDIESEDKGR